MQQNTQKSDTFPHTVHSLAGEELSDIGFHHPGAAAALIYLDAGYSDTLYDQAHSQILLDSHRLCTGTARFHQASNGV